MTTEITKVENALLIVPLPINEGEPDRSHDLSAIRSGEVWRLFTPMFVHYGILHLVFNMLWLLDLGSQIETKKGSLFILLLVLTVDPVANILQFYFARGGA